ncbi:MAG: flagellar filament capping protein FliD [Candidatus Sulfotelmatobacter sp.]
MGISLNPSTILSGQGIDVSSLVQQIITEQSGPISVWQQQDTTLASQNGALEGIEDDLTNLQTAVQALADPAGALAGQAATSSNSSVLTATAANNAVAGTHQIVVNNVATVGTLNSTIFSGGVNTSILSGGNTSGDIKLQVGTNASPFDIPITQGSNDTLTTLASYINTQSAANNWGVTANVVSNSSGAVLELQSQNTGSAGALSITSNNTSLAFGAGQGAANAVYTVDGLSFNTSSNTNSTAIQGVTLNLLSADPGTPVSLAIAPDTSQISTAVNNFVTAYNSLVGDINAQYVVDPTGATPAPPLESDVSLRSVQSSILADAAYSITGNGGFINLASLGINMNNDGTLTVGNNASGQSFDQIVASNPSAVQNFFQNASATGFANNFNTDLTGLTDPTAGPLNVEVTQNEQEQNDLTTNITNFQTQLNSEQTSLTQQYDSVNASLQGYPLLLQEITETLGTLGSGTSSSGALISSEPTLTSGL